MAIAKNTSNDNAKATTKANTADYGKPQLIALNLIKVDTKFQPRVVEKDEDHIEVLRNAYLDELEPPPAVHVWWDGKHFWLLDGFHRYWAMWGIRKLKTKFEQILCFVHEGTSEEAIEYAATANLKRGKMLSEVDRRKAMHMLMEVPEWEAKSPGVIGKVFGLSSLTAKKYYIQWFEKNGKSIPEYSTGKDGRKSATSVSSKTNGKLPRLTKTKNGAYKARVNGKSIYFRSDEKNVVSTLQAIFLKEREGIDDYGKSEFLSGVLTSNNINFSRVFRDIVCKRNYPGCQGILVRGVAAVSWSFSINIDAPKSIGVAICARTKSKASRVVVVCPVENAPSGILEIGRENGIEFMTIEDFITMIKAEKPDDPSKPNESSDSDDSDPIV